MRRWRWKGKTPEDNLNAWEARDVQARDVTNTEGSRWERKKRAKGSFRWLFLLVAQWWGIEMGHVYYKVHTRCIRKTRSAERGIK